MAERSFEREVQDLRLRSRRIFRGEGILAITKALAAVRRLLCRRLSGRADLASDGRARRRQGRDDDLGVHFETSASEAAAAATLSASVMYPVRGAVTWKSTAGTNVAADALSNLASGGVTGGALIIIGEDYGEGSSIMQERSHAYAMKSQIWLLDPRPESADARQAWSRRASNCRRPRTTPVMLEVRIRTCHVHGQFVAKDNKQPEPSRSREALENPSRDVNRIVLPPASFMHEKEKLEKRWPAAVEFIKEPQAQRILRPRRTARSASSCTAASTTASCARLQQLGLADVYGETVGPDLCAQCHLSADRRRDGRHSASASQAVLMVEEGAPEYHRAGAEHAPAPPRHPDQDCRQGRAADGRRIYARRWWSRASRAFLRAHAPELLGNQPPIARSVAPCSPTRRSRRSPRPCRRGRPASASAARSGRSSPR